MAEEPRDESWDRGLGHAFGRPEKSVLEALGARSRVSLRDAPGDPSPVVRVPPRDEPKAPEDDSRYQILGEIGHGGIGTVYKAHDVDLGRDVALKVLRAELAESDEAFQRFLEEAQVGGQLQHPGLVPVYGLGLQPDGRPFFAMKLVKGETLSAILRSRRDPGHDRRRFLAIFEQVCHAVAYAHSRGVVHRDLKPSNVMVGAFGEVQVVDWGFAKVLGLVGERPQRPGVTRVATVRSAGDSGSESQAGSVMGTPAYMPPEQALGHVEELDERSDVFALGAILCEIMTGQPPYSGTGRDQLVAASQCRLDDAWKRLDASAFDPEIRGLCLKCLSPLRRDRPQDAGQVAQAVMGHLHAVEERARQAEILAAEGRAREVEERARAEREKVRAAWERKARRTTIALAAAVLLAAVVGGWLYLDADARRARRQEHASAAVFRAMEEANHRLGDGDWALARAAAESAVEFARDAGPAERESAARLLGEARTAAERADAAARKDARNAAFVAQLTEIRVGDLDAAASEAAYAEAFSSFGIDVERLSPEEAGRLIRDCGDAVSVEIAAALDGWSSRRRSHENAEEALRIRTGPPRWPKLLRIASAADRDERRMRIRAAVETGDLRGIEALQPDELPVPTLTLVATALDWHGRDEEAQRLLGSAFTRRPGDFWIAQSLGTLIGRRAPVEAARFLQAAVALKPESLEARHYLGLMLQAAGDYDGAIAVWREVLASKPDYAHVQAHIAETLLYAGQPEAALEEARRAVSLPSVDVFAQTTLGRVLEATGRPTEALAAFRECLALEPDHALTFDHIARVLGKLGRPEEAMAAYRDSVRLGPNSPASHHNFAIALWKAGLLDEACAEFEESLRIQPLPRTLSAYAQLLGTVPRLRPPEELLALAQRAVEAAPEDPGPLVVLAAALYRNGRYRESVEMFEEARVRGAEFRGVLVAMAKWQLGEKEEAKELLRRSLEILNTTPTEDPAVRILCAEALQLIGK